MLIYVLPKRIVLQTWSLINSFQNAKNKCPYRQTQTQLNRISHPKQTICYSGDGSGWEHDPVQGGGGIHQHHHQVPRPSHVQPCHPYWQYRKHPCNICGEMIKIYTLLKDFQNIF